MRRSTNRLNPLYGRMRAPKHAPSDPFRILEHRHGLAEIVERGAVGSEERLRVIPPYFEREAKAECAAAVAEARLSDLRAWEKQ